MKNSSCIFSELEITTQCSRTFYAASHIVSPHPHNVSSQNVRKVLYRKDQCQSEVNISSEQNFTLWCIERTLQWKTIKVQLIDQIISHTTGNKNKVCKIVKRTLSRWGSDGGIKTQEKRYWEDHKYQRESTIHRTYKYRYRYVKNRSLILSPRQDAKIC